MGTLLFSINFLAKGCLGALIPTNPVWAVTIIGKSSRFACKITVKGPGQNCFARISNIFRYCWFIMTNFSACDSSRTWTIMGSVRGLFLVKYMFFKASSLKAFAPRPYTVSVGNATSWPLAIRLAASSS